MTTESPYFVLMNPFVIEETAVDNFLDRWKLVADYLSQQPGFIETELHRGLSDQKHWFNYAKWTSIEDFQLAISTPEFKRLTDNFPGEGQPRLYSVQVKISPSKN